MRIRSFLVAAAIATQGIIVLAGEPITVTVVASPDRIPLGVNAELTVRLANVAGTPVPVGFNRPPLAVSIESQAAASTYCPFCRARWGIVRRLLPEGWRHVESLAVPLPTPGFYTLRAVLKHHWNINEKPAEYPDLWWGHAVSGPVKVEVYAPEGVDKQAHEAFGLDPLGSTLLYRELLRRFPTSTYAAYVVRRRTHPGTSPPQPDVALYAMERGLSSFGPTPLPCVTPESAACKDLGFPPPPAEGARRQAAWLDLVLRSHPGIWFADELRFKRAYAAFFLGDKDGCEAGLEDLAQHGKPYVASKARELLAAMKAKGMLGEKAK